LQQACGCIIGRDYPLPIVDHDIVSKENMGRMKEAYALHGGGGDALQDEENGGSGKHAATAASSSSSSSNAKSSSSGSSSATNNKKSKDAGTLDKFIVKKPKL